MSRRRALVEGLTVLAFLSIRVAPEDAAAMGLDRIGLGDCQVTQITKAVKFENGSRKYGFKGFCLFTTLQFVFESEAAFDWGSTTGTAFEEFKVMEVTENTGNILGSKVQTIAKSCTQDPFVHGRGVCGGQKSWSANPSMPDIWAVSPPFLAGLVPANQAYTTPPPSKPADAGQIQIVTPKEGDMFNWYDPKLIVTVKPKYSNYPPQPGGWSLQLGRGSSCQPAGEPWSPGHYTAGAAVGQSKFPEPGPYCVRATSKPGSWTSWRRFTVHRLIPPGSSTQLPGGLPGSGSQMQESRSGLDTSPGTTPQVAARTSTTPDPHVARLQTGLAQLSSDLEGLGQDAQAVQLRKQVQTLKARLDRGNLGPSGLAELQRQAEGLKRQADGLRASLLKGPKPLTPSTLPGGVPPTKSGSPTGSP